DDTGQVVAGIVLRRSAGFDDAAVGQDEGDAEDVVDSNAVLERVRPTGVGGDVAADGAGALAGRVRGEVVAVRLEVVGDPQVADPRLNNGLALPILSLEEPFHPHQGDDDPTADGEAAAGKAGTSAAGQEGDVQLIAGADDHSDLLGRAGEDDDIGPALLDG